MSGEQRPADDVIFRFMIGLIAIFVLIMFLACFFQLLWNNSLVPAFSGANPISFWQAYGILLMLYICGRIVNMDFSKK